LPPEPQRALLDELIDETLSRIPQDMDCLERGARVIAKLRALVGDLPASADHHHSDSFGLLRHSLEVALKMIEECKAIPVGACPPTGLLSAVDGSGSSPRWQYVCFLAKASLTRILCSENLDATQTASRAPRKASLLAYREQRPTLYSSSGVSSI
jgi:Putative helicase